MFMKNIRGTVAYFRKQLYIFFSMFKFIDTLTLFMTLSANNLHWTELGMLLKNVNYETAILLNNVMDNMRHDPLLTSIHFEKRCNALMKLFVLSGERPLGKVQDYFARVEFQTRGNPHIHMFVLIDGVPNKITKETVPSLVSYVDSTIR